MRWKWPRWRAMCVVVWGHKFQIWAGPGSAHYSLTNAKPLRFGVFPCDTRSRDLCLHISSALRRPIDLRVQGSAPISNPYSINRLICKIQSFDEKNEREFWIVKFHHLELVDTENPCDSLAWFIWVLDFIFRLFWIFGKRKW